MKYDDLISPSELDRAALSECGFGVCARNPACTDLHCPGRREAREVRQWPGIEFSEPEPFTSADKLSIALICAIGVVLILIGVYS
jgi:hypothetical protein